MVKYFAIIILFFGLKSIEAQRFKLYEGGYSDEVLNKAVLNLLEGNPIEIDDKRYNEKSDSSLMGDDIKCRKRDLAFYQKYGWGNTRDIPLCFDCKSKEKKDISFNYVTISEDHVIPAFYKLDNGKLFLPTELMKSVKDDIGSREIFQYKIIDNILFVELDTAKWSPVFILLNSAAGYSTPLGEMFFINHYEEMRFFGKKYLNIYEFYLLKNPKGGCHDYLIWMDADFNIIRIDDMTAGYFRIE